jgi:phosphatidylserine synthase
MIPPVGFAIAIMTVMLWIMWSDTIRSQKPTPILYVVRIAFFLIASGVLILNVIRYPNMFGGSARVFAILAAVVGIIGAAYFARRLTRRA